MFHQTTKDHVWKWTAENRDSPLEGQTSVLPVTARYIDDKISFRKKMSKLPFEFFPYVAKHWCDFKDEFLAHFLMLDS